MTIGLGSSKWMHEPLFEHLSHGRGIMHVKVEELIKLSRSNHSVYELMFALTFICLIYFLYSFFFFLIDGYDILEHEFRIV